MTLTKLDPPGRRAGRTEGGGDPDGVRDLPTAGDQHPRVPCQCAAAPRGLAGPAGCRAESAGMAEVSGGLNAPGHPTSPRRPPSGWGCPDGYSIAALMSGRKKFILVGGPAFRSRRAPFLSTFNILPSPQETTWLQQVSRPSASGSWKVTPGSPTLSRTGGSQKVKPSSPMPASAQPQKRSLQP